MKTLFAIVIYFLFSLQAIAQKTYAVKQIPQELLPRASAVVRSMELNIEVKSLTQVSYIYKKAITILNKNGDKDAEIYIWYDKSKAIKSVKGAIYDEYGVQTAKLTEKSFSDVSATDNNTLFEDSRLKIFKPNSPTYPYTIEYEFEIRSKQSLNFPDWYPNGSTGVAVEQATLNFSCPVDFDIRFKETNYNNEVKVQNNKESKDYQWVVKDLRAIQNEPYSPLPEHYLTSVKIAPNSFSYQGIKGSFSDWHEYGQWMYEELLKNRSQIPLNTALYIRTLTKDILDPKEKARKVYEYMQQKTRYVSVQIGIGGYQPFLASEVDRTGYGDCKALVNYTQGLLNVLGIESFYVVVASGEKKKDAIPDFASMNQFDHVILCVPFDKDTIWADCTSKVNPFGYLGTFTDDRLAVACTPQGGKLLKTPRFEDNASLQVRSAFFKLDSSGSIDGNMQTVFNGWQFDNRDFLIGEPLKEQLKKIPEIYKIDNIVVDSFSLTQNKNTKPWTVESLKFMARDYGALNSNMMFVPINKVNRSQTLQEIRSRENELYINRGYIDRDSIVFELPDDYVIESLPKPIFLKYPFGSFNMKIMVNENKIHYLREIYLKQGNYPLHQYTDLVKFYRTIASADAERFVLKRSSL